MRHSGSRRRCGSPRLADHIEHPSVSQRPCSETTRCGVNEGIRRIGDNHRATHRIAGTHVAGIPDGRHGQATVRHSSDARHHADCRHRPPRSQISAGQMLQGAVITIEVLRGRQETLCNTVWDLGRFGSAKSLILQARRHPRGSDNQIDGIGVIAGIRRARSYLCDAVLYGHSR